MVVNITIFEKTDRIGGRTLTINPFGNLSLDVELGASIFIKKNHILYESVDAFNLKPRDPELGADPKLGIWDGTEFVFQMNDKDSFWWIAFKIIRKYGILAPRRTQNLMQSTIAKFLKLYEEPYFPFKSLTQRTHELELVQTTGVTGEQFLKANNVCSLWYPLGTRADASADWRLVCPRYCPGQHTRQLCIEPRRHPRSGHNGRPTYPCRAPTPLT